MTASSRWSARAGNGCVFVDDSELDRVILQHQVRSGLMPYIHPLRLASGRACLTEDSPWHHPHQHGIQLAFTNVNGCDFWHYPGQKADQMVGLIQASDPQIQNNSNKASWVIQTVWKHKDGSHLLAGKQNWSLTGQDDLIFVDLDWTLRSITDVTIKEYPYGGLFIRMPFRSEYGATVINSQGLKDLDTEQQEASWVDLHMPIEHARYLGDGKVESSPLQGGIAVFDHPDNLGHPVKWRVDHQRGINPSPCIKGNVELPSGTALQLRYRLVLHGDSLTDEKLDGLWDEYAKPV